MFFDVVYSLAVIVYFVLAIRNGLIGMRENIKEENTYDQKFRKYTGDLFWIFIIGGGVQFIMSMVNIFKTTGWC